MSLIVLHVQEHVAPEAPEEQPGPKHVRLYICSLSRGQEGEARGEGGPWARCGAGLSSLSTGSPREPNTSPSSFADPVLLGSERVFTACLNRSSLAWGGVAGLGAGSSAAPTPLRRAGAAPARARGWLQRPRAGSPAAGGCSGDYSALL